MQHLFAWQTDIQVGANVCIDVLGDVARIMIVQDLAHFFVCDVVNLWLTNFFPLFGTETIANGWVQVLTLHDAQRLLGAKVVTRSSDALRAHRLD